MSRHLAVEEHLRFSVVMSVALVGLVLASSCGPTQPRHHDEWDDDAAVLEPEISGDNAKDEARWRHELASDPWGDDSKLLTDDPPKTAAEYQGGGDDVPPPDFVGPPAPPTKWESVQKSSSKFGKIFFSLFTVLATLGMMAAPYLLMI